jgi:hypothetical protein
MGLGTESKSMLTHSESVFIHGIYPERSVEPYPDFCIKELPNLSGRMSTQNNSLMFAIGYGEITYFGCHSDNLNTNR